MLETTQSGSAILFLLRPNVAVAIQIALWLRDDETPMFKATVGSLIFGGIALSFATSEQGRSCWSTTSLSSGGCLACRPSENVP